MLGPNFTCDTLPDQIINFIIIFILNNVVYIYVNNYMKYDFFQ